MSKSAMNDASAEMNWPRLLMSESRARQSASDCAGRPGAGDALRAWWQAVADACFEYERAVAQREQPEPPPVQLIERLRGVAGYLAVGKLPDTVRLAAKRGRTAPGPGEMRDMRMAVAYHHACRPEGIEHNGIRIRIEDPDPIERIHLWYGVEKRTIYDWLDRYEPAFLGVNDVNKDIIISMTVRAAEHYRQAGRSQAATTARDAKRSKSVRPKR